MSPAMDTVAWKVIFFQTTSNGEILNIKVVDLEKYETW
jgi:hypothetical protein